MRLRKYVDSGAAGAGGRMKGTDCTNEQLDHARTFIEGRNGGHPIVDGRRTELWTHELVRLLAWYGALRFKSGRDGTGGTLEAPGELETRKADR